MSGYLDITLRCSCGASFRPRPFWRWAPFGVLNISGAVPHGWYVDGGTVACPEHAPADKVAAQDRARSYELAGDYE